MSCCGSCGQEIVVNVPGASGAQGAAGENGQNAFSLITNFIFGAAASTVTGTVSSNIWMAIGEYVFVSDNVSKFATVKITAFPVGTNQFTGVFAGNPGDATSGTITSGIVTPSGSPALTTPVSVANGGTGATTLTGLVLGNGTSTMTTVPFSTGTFVCNGVTPVTVVNTAVTANSIIIPTLKTVGGTVGAIPAVKTITPGTGFTIAGTASDSSTYSFAVIN